MPWPLSQDYNEAIQNPQTSFGDPELRRGAALAGATGIPMPRSGNFADVYEFIGDSGSKWAVKCFTREVPDLQDRYGEISKHLLQAKLRFTVDFEYLPRGIRIRGQFYPVLKMKWVDGFLLNEFVRDNLDKPKKLEALSGVWLRMAKGLRDANMAHADLQHGNVLLVHGRKEGSLALKLIDYDGMWVPTLANKKSGEVGHPNYQHPQRLQQGVYSAQVDRLPLLAIACALRALTVAGKALWHRYDNGDNLLFREADLRQPGQSTLFKELWNLPDAATHDLVGHLTLGLAGPLENTPFLTDLIADEKPTPLTPAQEMQLTPIQGPVAKVGRLVDSHPVQAAPVPLQATSSKASSPWDSLEDEPITSSQSQVRKRGAAKILLGVAGFVLLAVAVGVGIFMTRKGDEAKKQEGNLVQAKPETSPEPQPTPELPAKPELAPKSDPTPGAKLAMSLNLETNRVNLQMYLAERFPGVAGSKPPYVDFVFGAMEKHNELAKYPTLKEIKELLDATEEARDALLKEFPLQGGADVELWRALMFVNSPAQKSLVISGPLRDALNKYAGLVGKPKQTAKGGPKPEQRPSSIDLLGLIKLEKDSIRGKWSLIGKALVSPRDTKGTKDGNDFACVQIPYVPPSEYDVRIVLERKAGYVASFGLVVMGRQCLVTLDDQPEMGWRSGLDMVDNKVNWQNETAFKGPLLKNDTPSEVLIAVRKTGVIVNVDGKEVICYQGDFKRLSVRPDLAIPNSELLFLGTYHSVFHFKSIELRPILAPLSEHLAWTELDTSSAKVMDGFLRIDPTGKPPVFGFNPEKRITTKQSFSGPIEVSVIARTTNNNIRLDGPNGALVIFNWEVDKKKLPVHRPDSIPFKNGSLRPMAANPAMLESIRPDGTANKLGSATYVPFAPLVPNRWYSLKWLISQKEVKVFVDAKLVFSEARLHQLDTAQPIGVSAQDSVIDVKSFTVKSLATGASSTPLGSDAKPETKSASKKELQTTFLIQLKEFDVKNGPWRFGKGELGNPVASPIVLNGIAQRHSIGMHPPDKGYSSVKYRLEKSAQQFKARAGLFSDTTAKSPVTFLVLGDGKTLWSSKPVQEGFELQECDVDVSNVDILELRVSCAGNRIGAHAVWFEPFVQQMQR